MATRSSLQPTHPQGQVDNATAPSTGGSPDGKARLEKRLPFRTMFSHRGHRVHREYLPVAIDGTACITAAVVSDGKENAPVFSVTSVAEVFSPAEGAGTSTRRALVRGRRGLLKRYIWRIPQKGRRQIMEPTTP